MIRAQFEGVWFIAVPATMHCDFFGDDEKRNDQTLDCKGCMFEKRKPNVCTPAGKAAMAAGLPDCESRPDRFKPGYIYVRDLSNGRQQDLFIDT